MNFNNRTKQSKDKVKKVKYKSFKDSNLRLLNKLIYTNNKSHRFRHNGIHYKDKMNNFKGD